MLPPASSGHDGRVRIEASEAELEDLRDRLRRTRWPSGAGAAGWADGTDPVYLRGLVDHWVDRYDWRAEERRLNADEHVLVPVGVRRIHCVRVRGHGRSPIPLLLLHGWPGSFVQMLDLARLLAHPRTGPAFDVVVGSLPGFGWSEAPPGGTDEARAADVFDRVMTEGLGYARYAVHGSDFGAGVASHLVDRHPDRLLGAHLSGTSPRADGVGPDDPPEVQRYAADVARWRAEEVGYGAIQSTRPQTLAAALNDSPAGLAAWIVEKFRRWSDCGGDVERRFSKDRLLTNVMVYWLTGTIGSSVRWYRQAVADPDLRHAAVPIAHLLSARDMLPTPRAWVARTSRIDRFTAVDRGGHFIEWEEPELVADDLRAFLGPLAR